MNEPIKVIGIDCATDVKRGYWQVSDLSISP